MEQININMEKLTITLKNKKIENILSVHRKRADAIYCKPKISSTNIKVTKSSLAHFCFSTSCNVTDKTKPICKICQNVGLWLVTA